MHVAFYKVVNMNIYKLYYEGQCKDFGMKTLCKNHLALSSVSFLYVGYQSFVDILNLNHLIILVFYTQVRHIRQNIRYTTIQ